MLAQEAASYQYTVDQDYLTNPSEGNKIGLISANVQTWGDEFTIQGEFESKSTELFAEELSTRIRYSLVSQTLEKGDRIHGYEGEEYFEAIVINDEDDPFKVDWVVGTPPGPGTYTVNTGSGLWRMKSSYSWKGDDQEVRADGLYPYSEFQPFDSWADTDGSVVDQWLKTSEVMRYDIYSHPLEVEDVNGRRAAVLMDEQQEHTIAVAANASYDQFSYSGFENENDGRLDFTNANTSTDKQHTGYKSLNLQNGGTVHYTYNSESGNLAGQYVLEYWVNNDNSGAISPYYKLDDAAVALITNLNAHLEPAENEDGNTWQLHRAIVEIPSTTTAVNLEVGAMVTGGASDINIDDFRFYPIDASMTSYVYNDWNELTHILDANNFFTEYRYDLAGRLRSIHRERLGGPTVKVSEQKINYQRQ